MRVQLLPRLEKVIWLDADVIVRTDVCRLYDDALRDDDTRELAAVVEMRPYVGDKAKFDLSAHSALLDV
jgi:lipopolysaccharide biosynthesis glycosyltransferase